MGLLDGNMDGVVSGLEIEKELGLIVGAVGNLAGMVPGLEIARVLGHVVKVQVANQC